MDEYNELTCDTCGEIIGFIADAGRQGINADRAAAGSVRGSRGRNRRYSVLNECFVCFGVSDYE